MKIKTFDLARPTAHVPPRKVDFAGMSNDDLKFALDDLSAQNSVHEIDVLREIEKRIGRGVWLDLDAPPPSVNDVPGWLKVFPFCLLWKQRP